MHQKQKKQKQKQNKNNSPLHTSKINGAHHPHTNPQQRTKSPNNIDNNIDIKEDDNYNNNEILNKINDDKSIGHMPILSLLNSCDISECTERTKWTWTYIVKLIIRYATFSLIGITSLIIIAIILAKISTSSHPTTEQQTYNGGYNRYTYRNEYIDYNKNNADDLTGLDTLQLLTESVGKKFKQILNMVYYHDHEDKDDDDDDRFMSLNDINNININHISSISTIGSSTIFLKEIEDNDHDNDNNIKFIAFRKPADSWCSSQSYSFRKECVNIRNVRKVNYIKKTHELEISSSSTYPRIIEINSESNIILNDRIFSISNEDNSFREVTDSKYYQDGDKFCIDNILFIREDDDASGDNDEYRIIISGSCYGLLYLPKNIFINANELMLLSSEWSSIIIDQNMYINSLIIASNNDASIVFRSILTTQYLELAITDQSYVEFDRLREANYISMITLKGSTINIKKKLYDSKNINIASRNHSKCEIANIENTENIYLSISHFSKMSFGNIVNSKLSFNRQKNTVLILPKTDDHYYIADDKILSKTISF